MLGFLVRAVSLAFVAAMGWILGTVYPAPPGIVDLINPRAVEARLSQSLGSIEPARLERLLSGAGSERVVEAVVRAQAAAG